MDKIDFSIWKKNIENKIASNENIVRYLIANFSLGYNIECFNFLMGTQEHTAIGGLFQPYDLFIHSYLLKNKLSYEILEKINFGNFEQPQKVRLGIDPVFAYPWGEDRISDCLLSIGEKNNNFKMSLNHKGVIILPYNICFITGGNHSIFTGIFKKDGYIEVDSYCDYSRVLNDIDFNGEYYYLSKNHSKKVKASSVLLGLIFSLGKYIK